MKLNSVYIVFLILFGFLCPIFSQDASFSQFYVSPLTLNPALTGSFDGTYRVSAIYRDQWRTVANDPYSTIAASGEVQFQINTRSSNNPDLIGAGLLFFSDRVGTFELNTTQIALYGSYHKALSKRNNSYLGAGFQIGVIQRNINYEDLSFGDQFNGLDGYTLATGESLPQNNFGFGDFALGIHYAVTPSEELSFYAGASVFHLASPNVSFYQKTEIPNPPFETQNNILRKWSAYASLSLKTSDVIRMLPRAFYSQQGSHSSVTLGSNIRYDLLKQEDRALHFGGYVRASDGVDGFGPESLIFMFGLEINNVLFGLSYDANLSSISDERTGQGALEFSISFTGQHENLNYICPDF